MPVLWGGPLDGAQRTDMELLAHTGADGKIRLPGKHGAAYEYNAGTDTYAYVPEQDG
ncbi:hypothetical protein ACFOVU_23375 [Nocardiopsis sediminis]|uniref:Uncharacterized protein n=1 Tax=Nocardiopsis sediminis TaxID=1778267 RepID=A0ABV8FSR8_9ACTN